MTRPRTDVALALRERRIVLPNRTINMIERLGIRTLAELRNWVEGDRLPGGKYATPVAWREQLSPGARQGVRDALSQFYGEPILVRD
jgi:hypothetical protein